MSAAVDPACWEQGPRGDSRPRLSGGAKLKRVFLAQIPPRREARPRLNRLTHASASEHDERRACAHQSWKRQKEHYENAAYKLCVETTRSLPGMAAQQRNHKTDEQQKMWRQQQPAHNPFARTHLPPGSTGGVDRPAERQHNETKQQRQPERAHERHYTEAYRFPQGRRRGR